MLNYKSNIQTKSSNKTKIEMLLINPKSIKSSRHWFNPGLNAKTWTIWCKILQSNKILVCLLSRLPKILHSYSLFVKNIRKPDSSILILNMSVLSANFIKKKFKALINLKNLNINRNLPSAPESNIVSFWLNICYKKEL